MFKKGDKVICVNPVEGHLTKDKVYEVLEDSGSYYTKVKSDMDVSTRTSFCNHCFRLVPPEPTDQELADEFRAVKNEYNRLLKELTKRGYTILNNKIKKSITTVIEI